MTKYEAIVLSAYTGFTLTKDFSDVHKFIEKLLNRPVKEKELKDEKVYAEIMEKAKPLVVEIIEAEREHGAGNETIFYLCDRGKCEDCSGADCKHTTDIMYAKNFEPHGSGFFIETEQLST